MEQSNWFKVGTALISKLDSAGQPAKALAVREAMGLKAVKGAR